MTTTEIIKLLAERYKAPDYAFLSQVRNQTGYARGLRTADGLALGLWPSRGIYMHGFEIKTVRSDVLSELKHPDKADEIAKYCHYWWLVCPDKLVALTELPTNWGLLVVKGSRLITKKHPVLMQPIMMDYPMLAGIFRKMSETAIPIEVFRENIKVQVEKRIRSEEWSAQYRLEECEKLEKRVKEFEEKSGIEIDGWSLGNVAEAVRVIRDNEQVDVLHRMNGLRDTAAKIMKEIDEALPRLSTLQEKEAHAK